MNLLMIINTMFWIGLLSALIGGIIIVSSFLIFKRKVMKTPIYEEVELEQKKGFPWGYVLLLSGIVIYIISYYLSINYNM